MPSPKIDLVVGIDFGMTCTGVAFAKPWALGDVKMVQKWPDREGESHNKVPTTLLYGGGRHPKVKKWGFACQRHDERKTWFKRFLDERVFNEMLASFKSKGHEDDVEYKSIEQVRQCYKDYMTELYKHLAQKLPHNGSWENTRIEFIFSLPATFDTFETSTVLRELLLEAGFGKISTHHKVSFGLAEPQAAAVFTAVNDGVQLHKGDVLLVCDAGGGTTDLALLQQKGEDNDVKLEEILKAQGFNIGSTNIDENFSDLVRQRLQSVSVSGFDRGAAEYSMMHSDEFQNWKHNFGKPEFDERKFKTMGVPVPTIDRSASYKRAGIKNGEMQFSHQEFRSLFDPEIEGITEKILAMMDELATKDRNIKIKYLVLSGGLGSSAYLKSILEAKFTSKPHRAAPNIQIMVGSSNEPQLAVAKGLVLDRRQRIIMGKSTVTALCARASYGIVSEAKYDKKKHAGMRKRRDSLNGEEYVQGHVTWVIREGDAIDPDAETRSHTFRARFDEEGSTRSWNPDVVICHKPAEELPHNKNNPEVHKLCTVKSDFSGVPLEKLKHRQSEGGFFKFWTARTYYEMDCAVKFVVGSAHARFEMWHDGEQMAKKNKFEISASREDQKQGGQGSRGITLTRSSKVRGKATK